ncbi:MAG: hypothetical protein ACLFWM_02070 [Actinomycetota bacterium]
MLYRLVAVAAGIWLMLAPAVLGYGDPAAANDRLIGPALAASAFVSMWPVMRPFRWVAAPLAAWLILAPFLLGYAEVAATASSLLSGTVAAASTPPGRADPGRFGGGWRTLWSGGPAEPGSGGTTSPG